MDSIHGTVGGMRTKESATKESGEARGETPSREVDTEVAKGLPPCIGVVVCCCGGLNRGSHRRWTGKLSGMRNDHRGAPQV